MTKIITIVNQKGGCGKTTITMQLAGAIGKKSNTLIVDADPQGTATRWAASAQEEKPFPATLTGLSAAGAKLHQEVKKYINNFQYIFIDCPPATDNPASHSALLISDLAIIPIVPSPADLWASIGIQRLVQQVMTINQSLKARLLLNMCQPSFKLYKQTSSVLEEFSFETLKSYVCLRTAYRQSAITGETVLDLKGAKQAAIELTQLKKEVLSLLI